MSLGIILHSYFLFLTFYFFLLPCFSVWDFMLSMNKSRESTLVTVFTGNALSSFNMMLSLGLPFITFIILFCVPLILSFFIALSWRNVEFYYRVFIYLDDDIIFVFFGFLCDILCVDLYMWNYPSITGMKWILLWNLLLNLFENRLLRILGSMFNKTLSPSVVSASGSMCACQL